MNNNRSKIFISHASVDVGIAEYLETTLRQIMPQVEVFRTTRVGQIPSGTEWLSRIMSELKTADKYLVLLTPWGMSRPWVSFETGAAWMSNRTLVTVFAGEMSKAKVVEPFKFLQLLSIEQKEEAVTAFAELGGVLPDAEEFVRTVQSLTMQARNRSLKEQEWDKVDVDGKVYALDGPLEELHDGTDKPIALDKYAGFKEAGLMLVSVDPKGLDRHLAKGYSILYQIDFARKRKHRLLTKDAQILMAKRQDNLELPN
jgi:hypothetical protein